MESWSIMLFFFVYLNMPFFFKFYHYAYAIFFCLSQIVYNDKRLVFSLYIFLCFAQAVVQQTDRYILDYFFAFGIGIDTHLHYDNSKLNTKIVGYVEDVGNVIVTQGWIVTITDW